MQSLSCTFSATARSRRGFTLIELLIAMGVAAVLASVALPAYFDQVRKSRRSDAITAMAQVQQAQERYRANEPNYATHFVLSSGGLSGVGSSAASGAATSYSTPAGFYTLTLPAAAASSIAYNVRAQATGSQASDTKCLYLQLAASAGNITYSSGPTTALGNSAAANSQCWKR